MKGLTSTYHKLYIFILKNKIYHLFFWIAYVFLAAFIITPGPTFIQGLFPATSIVFLYALISYFNLYFLMPVFLYKRRYLTYLASLLLTTLLICFPLAILIYNFFPENEFLTASIWTPPFFLINSLYILFAVLLTSFLHLFASWFKKERTNKELERINIQNELKYLKTQINPHFLFNSLNNLYALTLKKSDEAPEMVLKLSNILRYLLYETGEAQVSLEKEINYLKDLIEIEKIRLGDRADIKIMLIGDLSNVMIEPLLFINFVENSFKHGVNTVSDSAWIRILIENRPENKILLFEIENSKPLEKKENDENSETSGGIGLLNAKKRLKLLYPNKHNLVISDAGKTYLVKLMLIMN